MLLQDTPKFSLLFRESFELTALLFFVTWIPLRIILALTEYPLIPSWFKYFTKVFKIPFDLPKILSSLLPLKFLLACIMVNPISLVVLMTFLVIIILSLLTQYVCEYTQSSLILINYLFGWASILLTGIGSRPIQLSLVVPWGYSTYPSLIRALLLIPCLGIHNSFAIELWVSQLFL